MVVLNHEFTKTIVLILNSHFPKQGQNLLENSELLQYLNIKTRAANRGSKSRAG